MVVPAGYSPSGALSTSIFLKPSSFRAFLSVAATPATSEALSTRIVGDS